jgi:UDP-glucose 4-epimerase
LKETRGLNYLDIPSNYHSNWMDNSRAKFELEWRPRYDLARLIDAAWTYRRAPGDPRKVWYPG